MGQMAHILNQPNIKLLFINIQDFAPVLNWS